jgi:threonine synthase
MSVRFHSTNHQDLDRSLAHALLHGQAADKGLFMPEPIPQFSPSDWRRMAQCSYPELAYEVLSRYVDDEFSAEELLGLCHSAYDYPVPLENVHHRRWVMRLDQGPTASFKDFAARMMGRMLGRLVKPGEQPLVILTATSGDTGSAVAQAFAGVPNIHVVVLFPVDEVSDRQRKQMTTIGGNVRTIGVRGKFDDCQAMVKRAFTDPVVSGIRFSSANSINIGRLLPQSVYTIHAWLRLADVEAGERIVVSVPSGNFGNLCGSLLAKHGGLPVERFVVSTNANDEVPIFFETADYHKIEPSRVCISNAMNVGHPSNLARLVALYGGHIDEVGRLLKVPDMEALRRDMWATSVSDAQTRATIERTWKEHGVMLEPHGAVGWAGLERYFAAGLAPKDALAVSMETAHPAKFPDEIRALCGVEPELPPSLARIEQLTESYPTIDVDYETFRGMVQDWHGA